MPTQNAEPFSFSSSFSSTLNTRTLIALCLVLATFATAKLSNFSLPSSAPTSVTTPPKRFQQQQTSLSSSLSAQNQNQDDKKSKYEFITEVQWAAGLNNLRALMLQSLFLAKAWGVDKVVVGPACLKLRNMQFGFPRWHRYLPPFDFVQLRHFPPRGGKRGGAGGMSEACSADGFRRLFSLPSLVKKLKQDLDMEVVTLVESVSSSSSSSSQSSGVVPPTPQESIHLYQSVFGGYNRKANPAHVAQYAVDHGYDDVIIVEYPSESDFNLTFADIQKLRPVQEYDPGRSPFRAEIERLKKLLVDDKTKRQDSSYHQQQQRVLVYDKYPLRILFSRGFIHTAKVGIKVHECPQAKFCSEINSAFRPSEVIQETFLAPIKKYLEDAGALKNDELLVVHYRKFLCDGGAGGQRVSIPQRVDNLIRGLVRRGKLAKRPSAIYFASGQSLASFKPLEEAPYNYKQVLSKESVNSTFNIVSYPFEVMAVVDYAVAAEFAADVVTMTGHRTSSWAAFVDLERRGKGKRGVLESEGMCS